VWMLVGDSAGGLGVGGGGVLRVGGGRAIPAGWQSRLCLPEIEQVEPYVQGFASWRKPSGAVEMVIVVGSRLHAGVLGQMGPLVGKTGQRLREPWAVAIDEADLDRLGIAD